MVCKSNTKYGVNHVTGIARIGEVPRGGQILPERIWSNEVRPQGRAQEVHEQSNHVVVRFLKNALHEVRAGGARKALAECGFAKGKEALSGRENGAQGRNRTTDTAIFNRMLYQLSYLGADPASARTRRARGL